MGKRRLNTVTMFVFDPSGDLMVKRSFSAAELSAKKATFALPDAVPEQRVRVLRRGEPRCSERRRHKTTLTALLERDAVSYNGTFAEVSTKAARDGGFVMSARPRKPSRPQARRPT